MNNLSTRHPGTQDGLARLHPGHLSGQPHLYQLAEIFHDAGQRAAALLPDSADLTDGLRALWHVKNTIVYAGVRDLGPKAQRELEESTAGE